MTGLYAVFVDLLFAETKINISSEGCMSKLAQKLK
jgi:hypothetical protein